MAFNEIKIIYPIVMKQYVNKSSTDTSYTSSNSGLKVPNISPAGLRDLFPAWPKFGVPVSRLALRIQSAKLILRKNVNSIKIQCLSRPKLS